MDLPPCKISGCAVARGAELRKLVHRVFGGGARGTENANAEGAKLKVAYPCSVLGDIERDLDILLSVQEVLELLGPGMVSQGPRSLCE